MMNTQKPNASEKSVYTPIIRENSDESSKSKKLEQRQIQWDWRKLLRAARNVSSVVSIIITLLKLLQEIGLIP